MKIISFVTLILFFSSCSTQLTKSGKNVRLVTENQKEKHCKTLDIITTSNELGWDAAHDSQNAMNDARNKVAELGGNGMKVISSNNAYQGYGGASEAVIQVEALSCNFAKK
ncbi:PF13698 domain protein [Bacteriovorax sp. BAL6_X]|uniref:DUF4156 domain-containing protein n=1 Tax=Bacteriovorax sp. BAL6_X TaxID=1201290 RepID=UPI000386D11E|nr:DUF4156 domain-containing protein [Bacteriovorax sp. BAL6_X]EPZ49341.1 PF13698 domain protein [Bacteriovorax sp. BAL6_X]